MRRKECPKCGADISDSFTDADPDTGIFSAGWFCDACDLPVEADDLELDDLDD